MSNNMNPFTDIVFLKREIELITKYLQNPETSLTAKLYITAVLSLGTDASPNDIAPDELGCAETVDTIHKKAFGAFIAGTLSLSTTALYNRFKQGNGWQLISNPQHGDIIISPTGQGHNPSMPNGHVGIVSSDNKIMSNSSASGLFLENYTLDTWHERYSVQGGYPVYYFRKV